MYICICIRYTVKHCGDSVVASLQAKHRRHHDQSLEPFVFPYHLGYRRNFTQVINWSGRCRGNGLEWEVADGCFEFSLTAEQLEQKKLKRKQAVSYFNFIDMQYHICHTIYVYVAGNFEGFEFHKFCRF